MTDKTDREIMQQALEALEVLTDTYDDNAVGIEIDAIIALRKRLAQPEQEPVAWLSTDFIGERYLPTPPQKREWQGLTDEEMRTLANEHLKYQLESYEVSGVFDLLRAVSKKLKEKNT